MKDCNVFLSINKKAPGWFLAIFLWALSGCHQARQDPLIIPDNWSPSLGQVQDFVETTSKDTVRVNQQSLSLTSQNLADLGDARLFIIYVRLIESLNGKERADLFKEQQEWLNAREKASSAAVVSKGGSLAPIEYNHVFYDMTKARLWELSKRLNQANRH